MKSKNWTLGNLAKKLNCSLIGDRNHIITGINSLKEANNCDASFLANPRYNTLLSSSKAGVVCIDKNTNIIEGKNFFICDNPSLIFQGIIDILFSSNNIYSYRDIHPSAVIDSSVLIEKNVDISPHVTIDKNSHIKEGTIIAPNVTIGKSVTIGKNCIIHANVVIRERSIIGNNVILQPGVVIGSCGFGYTTTQDGHQKQQQVGNVILEDDVEIGANTTINRARFKTTYIRKGTKIDNLVQIAHNVEIGPYNLIAAQTGIAGSAKTGEHVILGGQVGIVGHVELKDFVMVATRGGVSKNLEKGKYRGSPAIDINKYHRHKVFLRKIEFYAEKIKKLEQQLNKLINNEEKS